MDNLTNPMIQATLLSPKTAAAAAVLIIAVAGLIRAISSLIRTLRRRYSFRLGRLLVEIYAKDDIPDALGQIVDRALSEEIHGVPSDKSARHAGGVEPRDGVRATARRRPCRRRARRERRRDPTS